MNDQAADLRVKMKRALDNSEEKIETKVVAVASGKGGVGKSSFTINFALGLQNHGKKVLIIDLDIGMANVDILLGITSSYSIVDMLQDTLPIEEIIVEGPLGLSFVSGGSGLTEIFSMDQLKLDYFIQQISSLAKYDYIFFDIGAGISINSLQFLLSAHEIFIITTPEPTAITDAYAMIKFIHLEDENIPLSLIVNRVRHYREGLSTATNVSNVCKEFLEKEIIHLISIPEDEMVWKGVRSQSPSIILAPSASSSLAIDEGVLRYLQGSDREETRSSITGFITKLRMRLFRKGAINR
ncbi:MinD/ParA family protein [Evansella tamaricis]|uniref:MinD/ParA family protein n=1 Tax=Evansella tamaricis TaxID=2069301 RepID=A0ABS6JMW0_9BACI|nr:MinD/ParA family protein [Evansella tamaricis]MBU9714534.1 MinD/ParA family protein [Evansella tamaricis]